MSVPLLATFRMRFSYIVMGLTHTMNIFCAASVTGGVYSINANAGGAIGVQDAADAVGGKMAPLFLDADLTSFTYQLQERSGGTYITRQTGTPAGTPAATGTTRQASQCTFVLRDISNHFGKVILLETILPAPYHIISRADIDEPLKAFYDLFSVTSGTVANRPAYWAVTRGDNAYMSEPLVGMTGDLNDKVRRARGLV